MMLFAMTSSLDDVNITSLEVAGIHIHVSDDPVRNLGVLVDNYLSVCFKVNRLVQSACLHLKKQNIG